MRAPDDDASLRSVEASPSAASPNGGAAPVPTKRRTTRSGSRRSRRQAGPTSPKQGKQASTPPAPQQREQGSTPRAPAAKTSKPAPKVVTDQDPAPKVVTNPDPEPAEPAQPAEPARPARTAPWRAILTRDTVARYAAYGVVVVLVATLAGYLVAGRGEKVYAARSEVLYQLDAERPTGFLRQDRQLSTQLVALRSRAVLDPVATEHGLSHRELEDKLRVSVVEDSEVIRIEVRDPSSERAETLAAEITDEYLGQFGTNESADAREYLERELARLDAERLDLATRLAQLGGSQVGVPPTPEQTTLTVELETLLAQRNQVGEQLEEVTVAEFAQPRVEQITEAYALDKPVAPQPMRGAFVGALLGLVVAAGAVAVLARLAPTGVPARLRPMGLLARLRPTDPAGS